jgi:hypothetical protein
MHIEIWLYGPLARYAGAADHGSYAQLLWEMPCGAKMRDLVERLALPLPEKGITFVNGDLTDMPGVGADLERDLQEGDRVAIFHLKAMWPFQYRFGAATSPELMEAMKQRGLLHHAQYKEAEQDKGGGLEFK